MEGGFQFLGVQEIVLAGQAAHGGQGFMLGLEAVLDLWQEELEDVAVLDHVFFLVEV